MADLGVVPAGGEAVSGSLSPMREQLDELAKLQPGWLGPGPTDGEALTVACQAATLAVIDELLRDGHEARMYPRADGGILLEWFGDDGTRPPSIEWRGHARVWHLSVDNRGAVFGVCNDDDCDCDAHPSNVGAP